MQVVIVPTTEESADPVAGTLKIKKEEKERESDRERALKKEALEHDAVNQATRILGGEIKEIKTFGT
jgi:hypothetical protein